MFDFVAGRREVAALAQQDRTVQTRVGVVRLQHDDAAISVDRLVTAI